MFKILSELKENPKRTSVLHINTRELYQHTYFNLSHCLMNNGKSDIRAITWLSSSVFFSSDSKFLFEEVKKRKVIVKQNAAAPLVTILMIIKYDKQKEKV